MEKEMVNHPDHYKTGKFECIDVMLEIFGPQATMDFCLLNSFKYIYRCVAKGKKDEDIAKAMWYIDKYLEISKDTNTKSPATKDPLTEPGLKLVKENI